MALDVEPVMHVVIVVPQVFAARAEARVPHHRGRVLSSDHRNGVQSPFPSPERGNPRGGSCDLSAVPRVSVAPARLRRRARNHARQNKAGRTATRVSRPIDTEATPPLPDTITR